MNKIIIPIIASCFFACKPNPVSKPDILASHIDSSVTPGDDFFNYANGGWIKNNTIPAEESRWGIGNLVLEENLKRVLAINKSAAAENAAPGSANQKIGDFWKAAMDTITIESKGLADIKPYLDTIDQLQSISQLPQLLSYLHQLGVGTVVGMYVAQDDKKSDEMALKFWQDGLYLPDREYYFKTDSSSTAIVTSFKRLMTNYLIMSGVAAADATNSAEAIFSMESALAKAHRKIADLRDPVRNYNKMPVSALYKMAPSLQLDQYFESLHLASIDSVIVGQPEYYATLEKIVTSTPITTWKMYLRFRLLNTFTDALPDAYGKEHFKYTSLLSGATEQRPRWKRVLENEEDAMGELVGQLFVKEYFNETAKKRYDDLVEKIRAAFKLRIENLGWMTDSTRQKALVKLAAMKKKVGYPDKWKDFSSLEITPKSYLQNLVNANRFWLQYEWNKLGKPVVRDEWDMTPQTYNAYYNPSNNEIVLPAGIFTVPGYLDHELDDATVYGYAGASTIGHEITHGFDDEGRQFDEKGNLQSWWTKTDEANFNKRADVMVSQFDQYTVVDTFKINGRATLGENIADLGGIILGWDAFTQTAQYKKDEKIAGLTARQRYFLGYALGWLQNAREASLRNQALTDVHSPAKFRVNGPLADVNAFYEVFNVQPNQRMYLADSARVKIW
ncbi:MAG: M13 family metallopeptidase [Bacteroidota bacterium]